jgi:predicted transposase/invertase (TIGR01784 family)
MSQMTNIHDRFFKETLSHKEVARDFLENYLPQEVLRHLDLNTLKISKDTFVKGQREHYSDLLYEVDLIGGSSGYIYLLFEHKSQHDPYVALQVLRYMVEIWSLSINQRPNDERLPLIIPLVVYHGKKKGKRVLFSELIDIPSEELRVYVPGFDLPFYDLSPYSDIEIKGQIILQLILSCLKAKNEPETLDHVVHIFNLLARLDESLSALEWIQVIFRYIIEVMDIEPDDIRRIAQSLPQGKKEVVMSLAERLRMEGEHIGIQKGRMEGMKEGEIAGRAMVLRRLLSKRFGLDIFPAYIEEHLRNATSEELDLYAELILDAKTIDDVFRSSK